ncbi:light-harvesting protein [Pararhodospirillum photometricum]|nr:light-harvesting protein [Pararhodospirillum photometricum]CCA61775.1 light-harvesting protein beta [Pararhodospirillum photometricum DSM 122]
MADNTKVYPSGLTEKEAQEFHSWYTQGLGAWIVLSAFAHVFTYHYLPWF